MPLKFGESFPLRATLQPARVSPGSRVRFIVENCRPEEVLSIVLTDPSGGRHSYGQYRAQAGTVNAELHVQVNWPPGDYVVQAQGADAKRSVTQKLSVVVVA